MSSERTIDAIVAGIPKRSRTVRDGGARRTTLRSGLEATLSRRSGLEAFDAAIAAVRDPRRRDPRHVADKLRKHLGLDEGPGGSLSRSEKNSAGRVGSEHRENEPEDIFLEPGSRKYPVKVKREGEWKYDRGLLVAAAREARMHGHESLAKRADAIRKREFSGDSAYRCAECGGNMACEKCGNSHMMVVDRLNKILHDIPTHDAGSVRIVRAPSGRLVVRSPDGKESQLFKTMTEARRHANEEAARCGCSVVNEAKGESGDNSEGALVPRPRA